MNLLDTGAVALTTLYLLDRVIKGGLVTRFFGRPAPPLKFSEHWHWPTVALVQPVTRGTTNLAARLDARAALDYPGTVRHIVVCDIADTESQAICRSALPEAEIVRAEPDARTVASKVAKMAAGTTHLGDADVVCFVDDDILLPPQSLQVLIAPFYAPQPAGATFGLACQTSWGNLWESLMSGFVNANALVGYVPLTFFTDPYTVTGHIFALRRSVFEETGGMRGMGGRFDDDHEIARRVRALGLPCVQTPLVYQVENALASFTHYRKQIRRWFVMPREAMLPYLTLRERYLSAVLSLGNLMPSAVLFAALFERSLVSMLCVILTFAAFLFTYLTLEEKYLPLRTPFHRLLLLPVIAFLLPMQVLIALMLPGNRIEWRGKVYRAQRGGALEPLDPGKD